MARNIEALAELRTRMPCLERFGTVPISGGLDRDLKISRKFKVIDAFLDIGPTVAYTSTHIKSAILSLRHGPRLL